jgi:2-oxoglutarate dehydrogenase E2 component (dihydrolipoamide succinyltransferase)
MKKEVKVPPVGESITTGVVVSWFKHNGEQVQQGENLFELETEKSVLEIPAADSGTLETLVDEGTEVSIRQVVAFLSSDNEEAQPSAPAREQPAAEQKIEKPSPPEVKPPPAPSRTPEETPAPAPAAVPTEPSAAGERRSERVRMSAIRRRTAERLVQARQNAAYLTTFNEIDMQKVADIRTRIRDRFEKEHGVRIGFMSFFIKACCQALREFPAINTQVDGDEIVYHHFYDIGVAISIEGGLLVPVIRDADSRHFADIERTIADFAERARKKRLTPDELTGGTFTITNGGVFGSLLSTPIPAYPQTAILGMHAIKKRPVVIDEQVVIRPMMYVALSYDHRVVDGREAIRFLARVKEYIEEPDELLLEL